MWEPRKPGKPKGAFPDNVLELKTIFRDRRKQAEVIPLEAARRARRESREENEKKSE